MKKVLKRYWQRRRDVVRYQSCHSRATSWCESIWIELNLDKWTVMQPWKFQIRKAEMLTWKNFREQNLKTVNQKTKLESQTSGRKAFWKSFRLFNMRVWSWLRMNAGGVPNTCKSNGLGLKPSDFRVSGGRVSNAWITCRMQGDNSWKQLLIPHKRTVPHGTVWKDLSAYDGSASD